MDANSQVPQVGVHPTTGTRVSPARRFGRALAMLASVSLTASLLLLPSAGVAQAEVNGPVPPSQTLTVPPAEPSGSAESEHSVAPEAVPTLEPSTDPTPSLPIVDAGASSAPPALPQANAIAPLEDGDENGAITGTVTGPGGEPIPGVEVSAYRWDEENEYFDYVGGAATDEEGAYTVNGLAAGTYTLRFQARGANFVAEWWDDQPDEESATTFVVGVSETITGKNAELAVGATVSGAVVGPDGEPIPGVEVSAYRWDEENEYFDSVGGATTDEEGAYTVNGLAAGTYTLRFDRPWGVNFVAEWWDDQPDEESATTFAVGVSETITGKNAGLAVGGTITGRVTGPDGEPVPSIDVVPYRWDEEAGRYDTVGGDASTDEDGNFGSTGLPPGSYTLEFNAYDARYASEWWNDKQYSAVANRFDVVAGGADAVADAQLAEGASISGLITGHDGKPVAGASVAAFLLVGAETVGVGRADTDDDGIYTVEGLPAGPYALRVDPGDGVHASMWWDGGDAQLAKAAVLSGRVTNSAGDPVVGADVCLQWRPSGDGGCGAITDADGRYEWPFPLDPDTYDLRVIVDGKWYNAGWVTIPPGTESVPRDITVDLGSQSRKVQQRAAARVVAAAASPSIVVAEGQALTGMDLQLALQAPVSEGTLTAATPTITGTAKLGGTLTANAGTWAPAPVTLSYQWLRAGSVIAGATSSTYKVSSADVGRAISVTVTGSKTGYTPTSKTSTSTAKVPTPSRLSATPVPKISGTAKVGKKLTVKVGSWKPSPVTLSYQWYRSGKAISGATKSTYTLSAADKGKKVTVKVTGIRVGYTPVTKTSKATKAVASGSLSKAAPKISGTAKVGHTLTARSGTWKPSGVTLKYQWYRSGSRIKGATKSTHTLSAADKGKKIAVKVIGSKAGYSTTSKTSKKTKSVAVGSLHAVTPSISGTGAVGQTLAANPGTWTPSGVKLAYQWYRGNTKIKGATKSTYTLSAADKGKKIIVRVIGSKGGYATITKTSAAATIA